ncbi:thioredoxin family protein [Natrialbaceae archaeon GCM10025810]|uniref:thioredoxin family protein n=1 Tax=Halovalidus salilacus TaxID=3075124 RepID=UPI0036080ED9
MIDADITPKPVCLEDGDALDEFVRERDLALVELYTAGCSKCQAMEPVLGNVARATGIPVGFVNPRDDLELLERFDVRSVPTLILFEDGEEVARIAEGFLGAEEVLEFVRRNADGDVEFTE